MKKIIQELKFLLENKEYYLLKELLNNLDEKQYPKSIINFYLNQIPKNLNQESFSSELSNYSNEGKFNLDQNTKLGPISKVPFVSIIIVSYNSGKDLKHLLPTLLDQTYTNWELIIVDNGNDNTLETCKKFIEIFKYIKFDNVGFAEANNIGLSNASGELILLLNPDTKLDKDTIKNLVFNLRLDASAAAASPLIYFYEEFQKINLKSPDKNLNFNADFSKVFNKLSYKKIFLRKGIQIDKNSFESANGNLSLDISIPKNFTNLELSISKVDNNLKDFYLFTDFNFSEDNIISPKIGSNQKTKFNIKLNKRHHSSSRLLINNAGSGIRENGQPYDIGFGEEDNYSYNQKIYINAFCGCCVLLRRDLFIKRKIFVSEFFAYFEDSELSNWIIKNKMRIIYVPTSKVYHKHSESTEENSVIWQNLVLRSKNIYDSIVNNNDQFIFKNKETQYSNLPKNLRQKLQLLDKSLHNKSKSNLINFSGKCVGIYNSYWNTYGGGEKHALDFANIMIKKGYKVFLISETEFNVKELSSYFGIDLDKAIKIVSGSITSTFTSRFEIFINSTFHSNLISLAKNSYYIVSFPHKSSDEIFMSSYHFLYNSDFTEEWSQKLWSKHKGITIYPILGFNKRNLLKEENKKEKFILNVGRFNLQGHCKNQHLIARSFKKLILNKEISEEWQLIFIGSVDKKSNHSIDHLELTKNYCYEKNTKFFINADREIVDQYYLNSAIYIHATGLGIDSRINPEKCEHFGISTFEAIINGCIPVVSENGGPYLQIKNVKNSFSFSNEEQLEQSIISAIALFNSSNNFLNNIQKEISQVGEESLERNLKKINELF